MKKFTIMKLFIISLLLFVLTFVFSTSAAAYGSPSYDHQTAYFTWTVIDDIPRLVGADCVSNLTQYAMIVGQYIGFHEVYLFACADPTSPFDSVTVNCSYQAQYYKESMSLGTTSLSTCYDPIWVSPDWNWDYHSGNAGGLLGTGQGTYYAKSSSVFYMPGSLFGTRTINNSVSFTVTGN